MLCRIRSSACVRFCSWSTHRRPGGWFDVLVESEDVRWIVRVLEGDQALVVDTVRSPYLLFPFVAQKVRIDSFHGKWEECCLESAHPFRVPLSLMGVAGFPACYYVHDIRHLAQGKGRGGRAHPAGCSMHVLNQCL